MTDYIKREDAIKTIEKITIGAMNIILTDEEKRKAAEALFADIPSADVVEVVRCNECIHKPNGYTDDDVLRYPNFPHEENNPCPCQVYEDKWYSWIPNDDFYCSYGERKDD